MLELELKRDEFVKNFLNPITYIGSTGVLKVSKGKISCTLANASNTLFAKFEYNINYDGPDCILNVGDVNKLAKVLGTITDDTITLKYTDKDNKISYQSGHNKFSMVLLDPSVILVKRFNFDRIAAQQFDSKFSISASSLNTLMKFMSCTAVTKMYLTSNDEDVIVEITDKTMTNTDSFSTSIASDFVGAPVKNMCLSLDILQNVGKMIKSDIKVSISAIGVVLLEYSDDKGSVSFATSSLKA